MGKYDDIIGLEHHVSDVYMPMPVQDRAAQFSPFAALTGYEESVQETARLTDEWREPDETVKAQLDEKISQILERDDKAEVCITHFCPDQMKSGGAYVKKRGVINKINMYNRNIEMADGTRIEIDKVIDIQLLTENKL